MAKSKIWRKLEVTHKSSSKDQGTSSFIKNELIESRRVTRNIITEKKSIDVGQYRSDLFKIIKEKSSKVSDSKRK